MKIQFFHADFVFIKMYLFQFPSAIILWILSASSTVFSVLQLELPNPSTQVYSSNGDASIFRIINSNHEILLTPHSTTQSSIILKDCSTAVHSENNGVPNAAVPPYYSRNKLAHLKLVNCIIVATGSSRAARPAKERVTSSHWNTKRSQSNAPPSPGHDAGRVLVVCDGVCLCEDMHACINVVL